MKTNLNATHNTKTWKPSVASHRNNMPAGAKPNPSVGVPKVNPLAPKANLVARANSTRVSSSPLLTKSK